MDEKLREKIIEIIANHAGMNKEEIAPEADLVRDLNIQRIDIPEIVMILEQELQIKLHQDSFEEIRTVEDLITLVSDPLL
ncbi:acyl carrier protein [Candidatus Shapirobacteria bacterium CG08_land_8_20_14_0_20_39_18]|uniref:Acyl carrier protein n=1 Tax=Candidatus Shapirobacteria bacterium CG08_land_8_20_14_0_20_39_18 TaxID=1974883 RepID=A0A2M6XD38_9BACT|nr:MAG: acyl carrier protein [Candidatus Shapirobacteria bacterium CG08_land_8_20_14_0_20_39_18]PIY66129.1 MAG: acyl carrier protein [Candidatus Shapirobacteria bacterium CG_4_10_14_0_8_um_filter_39_15]PJE68516.1 MAG: acyl carrier protein [Candidatus Shapirobacteria bacterium CG10_big_fil_rev_8_21_14_0_10_38_8]